MGALTVHDLDDRPSERLEQRAAVRGLTAEELPRRIPKAALAPEEPPTIEDLIRMFQRTGELGLDLDRRPAAPPIDPDDGRGLPTRW